MLKDSYVHPKEGIVSVQDIQVRPAGVVKVLHPVREDGKGFPDATASAEQQTQERSQKNTVLRKFQHK